MSFPVLSHSSFKKDHPLCITHLHAKTLLAIQNVSISTAPTSRLPKHCIQLFVNEWRKEWMKSKESELQSLGVCLRRAPCHPDPPEELRPPRVISLAFGPIEGHTSSSFWRSLEDITQHIFSSTHSIWEGTAHGVSMPACLPPFFPLSGISLEAPALSPLSLHQCPQGACPCISYRPPISLS